MVSFDGHNGSLAETVVRRFAGLKVLTELAEDGPEELGSKLRLAGIKMIAANTIVKAQVITISSGCNI
jgi:hypothetical protein